MEFVFVETGKIQSLHPLTDPQKTDKIRENVNRKGLTKWDFYTKSRCPLQNI